MVMLEFKNLSEEWKMKYLQSKEDRWHKTAEKPISRTEQCLAVGQVKLAFVININKINVKAIDSLNH